MSRGFGRHADGEKVIVVNVGYYIVHKTQVFYHTGCFMIIPFGVELVKLGNI